MTTYMHGATETLPPPLPATVTGPEFNLQLDNLLESFILNIEQSFEWYEVC